MPASSLSRARDIFRKPSLRKSNNQTPQHGGPKQEISVPSIDATISLLYSDPQDAISAQGGARVTTTHDYSRYARPPLGTWEEQELATRPPLSARPAFQDQDERLRRRRGSEPSNCSRPSRSELLGRTLPQAQPSRGERPQRSVTLGRSFPRADDGPSESPLSSVSPSPKRYAVFYNEQLPFLEAVSQLFGPTPSPTIASSLFFHASSLGDISQESPHNEIMRHEPLRDPTADVNTELDSSREGDSAAEPPCEIYFTIDPTSGSDDGDVTLVFTDRP